MALPLRAVLGRVAEQVLQHLADVQLLAEHERQVERDVHAEVVIGPALGLAHRRPGG